MEGTGPPRPPRAAGVLVPPRLVRVRLDPQCACVVGVTTGRGGEAQVRRRRVTGALVGDDGRERRVDGGERRSPPLRGVRAAPASSTLGDDDRPTPLPPTPIPVTPAVVGEEGSPLPWSIRFSVAGRPTGLRRPPTRTRHPTLDVVTPEAVLPGGVPSVVTGGTRAEPGTRVGPEDVVGGPSGGVPGVRWTPKVQAEVEVVGVSRLGPERTPTVRDGPVVDPPSSRRAPETTR